MFKKPEKTAVNPCDVTFFNATFEGFTESHVVYEIWQGETLQYIGACRFSSFPQLPDARNNAWIAKNIRFDDSITVRIIATGNKLDCMTHRRLLIRNIETMPPGNRHGAFGRFTAIMCEQDGRIFRTQTEAAIAYGISQGNLSAHLRGVANYGSIAGRTFRRVAG